MSGNPKGSKKSLKGEGLRATGMLRHDILVAPVTRLLSMMAMVSLLETTVVTSL